MMWEEYDEGVYESDSQHIPPWTYNISISPRTLENVDLRPFLVESTATLFG